jgi:MYND finger
MVCAQCESAFYCCRDCQVAHWKSGHKSECSVLQRLNEAKAQKVLGNFFEDQGSWKLLDKTGAYKAAVRQGLHDKIREVLEFERDTFHDRFRSGEAVKVYTYMVMFTLFRAYRAEGNSRKYWGMDGQRIKAYVTSHPDALLSWLHASNLLLTALIDRDLASSYANFSALGEVAGDVWKGWVGVFTNPVASRAVLLPLRTPHLNSKDDSTVATRPTKSDKREMAEWKRHARHDHAKKIVSVFLEALNLPWTREEPERVAYSQLRLAAAMVCVRLREYKVDVNTVFMVNGYAFIAVAKALIAKGDELNELEFSAIEERAIFRIRELSDWGAALACDQGNCR